MTVAAAAVVMTMVQELCSSVAALDYSLRLRSCGWKTSRAGGLCGAKGRACRSECEFCMRDEDRNGDPGTAVWCSSHRRGSGGVRR